MSIRVFFLASTNTKKKKAESVKHAKRWWWWWFGWCESIKRKRQNFKKKENQTDSDFFSLMLYFSAKNTQTQRLLWTKAVDSGNSVQSNIDSIVFLLSFLFSFSSKKKKQNKMSVRNHKKKHTVKEHWVNEKTSKQTLILKFRVERFSDSNIIDKKPSIFGYHCIDIYGWMDDDHHHRYHRWYVMESIVVFFFISFLAKEKKKKIIVYISILCFATLIRFFVRQIYIVCACVWMWNGWIEIARDDDDKKYEDIESRESKESKESRERERERERIQRERKKWIWWWWHWKHTESHHHHHHHHSKYDLIQPENLENYKRISFVRFHSILFYLLWCVFVLFVFGCDYKRNDFVVVFQQLFFSQSAFFFLWFLSMMMMMVKYFFECGDNCEWQSVYLSLSLNVYLFFYRMWLLILFDSIEFRLQNYLCKLDENVWNSWMFFHLSHREFILAFFY